MNITILFLTNSDLTSVGPQKLLRMTPLPSGAIHVPKPVSNKGLPRLVHLASPRGNISNSPFESVQT